MSSSFRASPWVTYEPSIPSRTRQQPASDSDMDEDVEMDAPQISTLREEVSPPPPPPKKNIIHIKKRPAPISLTRPSSDKAPVGNNEEDDQLIDELIDDDDELGKPSPSSQQAAGRSSDSPQKRKVSAKRKPRKSEKKLGDGEKKIKENLNVSQPTDTEIAHSSPLLQPSEPPITKGKKVSPRKPANVPRAKAKLAKQKSAIPPLLLEDAAILSESYTGTAASSPVTLQFEQHSPEPENIPPSSPHPVLAPSMDEPNLENVPIPVYPLPTKPFPVQPPQKIVTGFASLIPLDKGGRKVRHWREAKREIRGIAGGRWLARTWVGDKDSEHASFVASNNSQSKATEDKASIGSVTLPKLSSVSISAPASVKALSRLKASSKSGSTVTSAAPSRAPSAIPESQSIPSTSAVRAPTKMRILQLAPSLSSEGGDSDMAPIRDA